jgi:hypothetical protein
VNPVNRNKRQKQKAKIQSFRQGDHTAHPKPKNGPYKTAEDLWD